MAVITTDTWLTSDRQFLHPGNAYYVSRDPLNQPTHTLPWAHHLIQLLVAGLR